MWMSICGRTKQSTSVCDVLWVLRVAIQPMSKLCLVTRGVLHNFYFRNVCLPRPALVTKIHCCRTNLSQTRVKIRQCWINQVREEATFFLYSLFVQELPFYFSYFYFLCCIIRTLRYWLFKYQSFVCIVWTWLFPCQFRKEMFQVSGRDFEPVDSYFWSYWRSCVRVRFY